MSGEENVLGRSACAAISSTRAARLVLLDELKRTAPVRAVMGRRVKTRANMFVFEGVLVERKVCRGFCSESVV